MRRRISLYALNFMTFGNMSQQLWPNMVGFFFVNGQSRQIRKNNFFLKLEIGLLKLYICGKLWIIPFLSMRWKLWGVSFVVVGLDFLI